MNSRTRRFLSPRLTRLENRLVPALFTVSNLADAGAGSLREAIGLANATLGADTIQFSVTGTITLITGELAIKGALDIQGPGADKLTISGKNATRIFSTTAGVPLTLDGMRLTQGQAPVGGAIYAQGKLTIADSILEANTGTSFGGAVASTGLVVIQRSSILANVSTSDGGGLIVGGLLLDDSTVSGNIAADRGGGIVLSSLSYTTFQVRNCTFSGNQARRGAAIELGNNSLAPFDATLVLTNSTVARNVATDGGAVQREHGTGVITIESSIVAENQGSLADIASSGTVNVNYSAIGSPLGFTLTGGNNLSFGVDLKLAATLAFNGGAGATLMPALDSPVANKGSNPGSLITDQRGDGFIRVQGGGIDIGAVEVPVLVVANNGDSGPGSLRQAIIEANSAPGADTITFDPLYFAVPRTIALAGGEMAINAALSISGPGADKLTVDAQLKSRIFNTSGAADGEVMAFSGMTLTGGQSAIGKSGGAIYQAGEDVTVRDCILTGNRSNLYGGAIAADTSGASLGKLTVVSCQVGNNWASSSGGGLSIWSGTSVTILDSTIFSNTSQSSGGGVHAFNIVDSLIRQSTFSGNRANRGGAIAFGASNVLPIQNSTIVYNWASLSGGGIDCVGSVELTSSIVFGNTTENVGPDVYASKLTAYSSVIGTTAGITTSLLDGKTVALLGQPLYLGSLEYNGGPTATHALLPGSPAIDQGSNPGGLLFDQRGVGSARVLGAGIDIGAFESPAPQPATFIVTHSGDSGPGSLRQAILDANDTYGADTITFDPLYFAVPRTISLSGGEMAINGAVSIDGPGADKLTVDAEFKSRIFNTSGAADGAAIAFSGMTLTRGYAQVINSLATSGGAIFIAGEDVTISNCVLSGNTSTRSGGAIGVGDEVNASPANLTVASCQFKNNVSHVYGGGIYFGYGIRLSVDGSLFSANKATSDGGGLYFTATTVPIIRQSTFSGNSSTSGSGGGIFCNIASVSLQNCTIVQNTARLGGGIAAWPQFNVSLSSTIVDDNKATHYTGTGPDFYKGKVTAVASAIGTIVDVTTFTGDVTTNALLGQDFKLGPLADNGGGTLTHALLPGSPVIDAGSNPAFLTTDQRQTGYFRTFGFATDIGAFETQLGASVLGVTINGNDPQRSRVTSVAVVFDRVVNLPTLVESAFQLERQSDGLIVGLSASVADGAETTVTLTFTGPNTESGSLLDGKYTLRVFAAQTNGGFFDANGDGTPGDDFVLTGDTTSNKLFRLFGDINGDGFTDNLDLIVFRAAIGSDSTMMNYNPSFDFNADGFIDNLDLLAFRTRLGMTP